MNKISTLFLLILLSFLLLLVQTTLLSPDSDSLLSPDLNLIFIIFLAMSKDIPGAVLIVILNGYMMDVMSGYTLGIHTFSRLIVYLIISNTAGKVNFENVLLQSLAFFAGTVFTWIFVWVIFKTKFSYEPIVTLEIVINQATINCIAGVIFTYIFSYSYAKLQK